MMENENLSAVGQEILRASRAELCMALPYLSGPICALAPAPGDNVTVSAATDGETLHYNASYLATCYLRGSAVGTRRSGISPATPRRRASWTPCRAPAFAGRTPPSGRSSTASAGGKCRC